MPDEGRVDDQIWWTSIGLLGVVERPMGNASDDAMVRAASRTSTKGFCHETLDLVALYSAFANMSVSRGAQIAARLLQRGTKTIRCDISYSNNASQFRHPAQRYTNRCRLHTSSIRQQQVAAIKEQEESTTPESSNPAMSFPCLDAQEQKTATLQGRSIESGPEPTYSTGRHLKFHSKDAFLLDWGGVLPEFEIAYETWGKLNGDKSNAILLHTGLSAPSHAHSTEINPKPGWWEKFIGPGAAIDTNKYFVICTNPIGGCYGSTGPSSIDPSDGKHYATRFPILTMDDVVRAQSRLLDHLGIHKLYASVGASMGGMTSLAFGVHFPERVHKIVSISGCARSHPYSIAMRHTQRQVLMMDPNWSRGFYYDKIPPHFGMKLAREIATVTYRSGPEWEERFGRKRADPSKQPALCPDFLIETYLDHAGEKFSLGFDPNSFLYVSKAMDLFDLGAQHQSAMTSRRSRNQQQIEHRKEQATNDPTCSLTLPEKNYEETVATAPMDEPVTSSAKPSEPPQDLVRGMSPLRHHQTLVMGVASDILFPAWQQKELADTLRAVGNTNVTHIELGEDVSQFGHDTFLLDVKNIGGNLGKFLA